MSPYLPVLSFTPFSHLQVCLWNCDSLLLPSSILCFPCRFVTIYRGPSHTYKVQRLTESSSYSFRIQAISEAGEGPFSDTHTFCTTKCVPPALKGKLTQGQFCCYTKQFQTIAIKIRKWLCLLNWLLGNICFAQTTISEVNGSHSITSNMPF